MKRFAEALHEGLAACIVRHEGDSVGRSHGAAQNEPTAPAPHKSGTETMGNVEMSKRVEAKSSQKFIAILVEKAPRATGSSVRNDEPDIEVVNHLAEAANSLGFGEVDHNGSRLDVEALLQLLPQLVEERFATRGQNDI